MFILIADNGPLSVAAEKFLNVRGVRFERATERFAAQFQGCERPSVVAGACVFEGIGGIREAVLRSELATI